MLSRHLLPTIEQPTSLVAGQPLLDPAFEPPEFPDDTILYKAEKKALGPVRGLKLYRPQEPIPGGFGWLMRRLGPLGVTLSPLTFPLTSSGARGTSLEACLG